MRSFLILAALILSRVVVAGQGTVERPGGSVSVPVLVKAVKPAYTSEAKAAKIEGTVLIEAVVLEDGTVGTAKIIRSLDTKFGLDREAAIAARQWLFKPAMKGGKPVAVLVTIELSFTLPKK